MDASYYRQFLFYYLYDSLQTFWYNLSNLKTTNTYQEN